MTNNNNMEDTAQSIYDDARQEKMSELHILQQSLEEKKRQANEYYDQLLRLKAEFENFRRRTEKEKQNHLLWGKEEILLKQIGLLDVIDQAFSSITGTASIESIKKGLELLRQEFVKMLSSEGILEIESAGRRFDPAVHEAVEQVESDRPEGTVVGVLQKGYTLGGRVIRPARVRVARTKENKNEQSGE